MNRPDSAGAAVKELDNAPILQEVDKLFALLQGATAKPHEGCCGGHAHSGCCGKHHHE